MVYKLEKPYTDIQKFKFIDEYQGFIPYEDEDAFYFLADDEIVIDGKIVTNPNHEAEQAEKARIARIEEIKSELNALDAETVRPLRAEIAGTATDEDIQKLKDIEERVKALREEYRAL